MNKFSSKVPPAVLDVGNTELIRFKDNIRSIKDELLQSERTSKNVSEYLQTTKVKWEKLHHDTQVFTSNIKVLPDIYRDIQNTALALGTIQKRLEQVQLSLEEYEKVSEEHDAYTELLKSKDSKTQTSIQLLDRGRWKR